MAKLFGNTNLDPVEAPLGIVSTSGNPVVLPQGFTLPVGKTAAIAGTLTVTGPTTLFSLVVTSVVTLPALTTSSVLFSELGSTALSSYSSGSFVGTVTGITGVSTRTFNYVKIGNAVILSSSDGFSGVSNSVTMTITGMPVAIRPASLKQLRNIVIDGGINSTGRTDIQSDGTITFYKDVVGTVFTASGTKGILSLAGTYTLS